MRWLVTAGLQAPVGVRQEDVVRLQVAVNHALGVGCSERVDDGQQDLHGLDGGESALAVQDLAQGLTLQELHDHEGLVVSGPAEVEHAADGRVLEPRGGPRLGQEAVLVGLRGHVAADQLERHLGIERQVLRDPHRAHAPLAQEADELVLVGDDLADHVARARFGRDSLFQAVDARQTCADHARHDRAIVPVLTRER